MNIIKRRSLIQLHQFGLHIDIQLQTKYTVFGPLAAWKMGASMATLSDDSSIMAVGGSEYNIISLQNAIS